MTMTVIPLPYIKYHYWLMQGEDKTFILFFFLQGLITTVN